MMRSEPYQASTRDDVTGYMMKGSPDDWQRIIDQLRPETDPEHFYLRQQILPQVQHIPANNRKIQIWMAPPDAQLVLSLWVKATQ